MNKILFQKLSKNLMALNETVAVAESVTAGLVLNHLSRAENATKFLQGGIVAYNLGQKARHLHVNPILADAANCVSEEIAIEMAKGVSLKFCSHWGLAITGYAVPVPALNVKSCFAYYAFVRNSDVVRSSRFDTRLRGQVRVQQYYVDNLLSTFIEHIK